MLISSNKNQQKSIKKLICMEITKVKLNFDSNWIFSKLWLIYIDSF